jgi:hypothetical protein
MSSLLLRSSFLLVVCATLWGAPRDRRPSEPYITGDTFRAYAHYILDEEIHSFPAEKVQKGDVIFVQTGLIEPFFTRAHPKIQHPYILVTHNNDLPAPGPGLAYLDDPKLIAWFAQNVETVVHPKLHPIPIGLENRYNSNGNPLVVTQEVKKWGKAAKQYLLYMNFYIGTRKDERTLVHDLFKNKPFCKSAKRLPYRHFLRDMAQSYFVLCPRGNGLDCHRPWEALLMGSIPIVKSSAMDSAFDGLPVVIVRDWNEITEEFLRKKLEEMQKKTYALDRLYFPYWKKMVEESRKAR